MAKKYRPHGRYFSALTMERTTERIMIHQYKLNGYNIVLDVNSGSVHVVDEVAYDMIAAYADTPRDELIAAMGPYGRKMSARALTL